jgi:hypothetical protein
MLDSPVTDVTPVAIATAADADAYPPGTSATTFGYGVTDVDQTVSPQILRSGRVTIHSDRACLSMLRQIESDEQFVAATMLCTADPDHRPPYTSGCFGDSGGPLVVSRTDGTPLEVGIDNWGVFCGDHHGDPENYADVAVIAPFATAASPSWQPLPLGRPMLRGTIATGHVAFCQAPAYADPQPTKLTYRFSDATHSLADTSSRRFVIPGALAHRRLFCTVKAQTQGGTTVSEDSLSTLVAGRGRLHG